MTDRPTRRSRRGPRRLRAALAAPLLLVAGCTGTFETLPPLLLVTSLEGSVPQLVLIEDTYLSEDEVEDRFVFLEESRRDLPAPAVSFDVVDRAGARSALAVLSRGEGAAPASYLSLFNLASVDPADPSSFSETLRIDLTEPFPDAPCFAEVQISEEAEYAVLFADRGECVTGDTLRSVYVLDLDARTVEQRIDTEPVLAAGIYLDQVDEQVYFLASAVGGANLRNFALPDGAPQTVTRLTDDVQVDLAPVQVTSLVALSPARFEVVDLDDLVAERTPVDTTNGSQRLLRDDLGLLPQVLILSDTRFTVHTSVDDADETALTVSAASGTVDPVQQFVYLMEDGGIRLFDLLRFEGSFSDTVERFPIAALDDPGLVTWVRSPTTPTPP